MIERFGKVLNLHHRYSIFLLINIFPLMKYINEETNFAFVSIKFNFNIAASLSIIDGVYVGRGGPTKTYYDKSRLRCILIEPDP